MNNSEMGCMAPVVLFAYNRKDHLQRTIEALNRNIGAQDTIVYVFSDGFKSNEDSARVMEVRDYLHSLNLFKQLYIIERQDNIGLRKNIENGVSEIVTKYGKVIVLEDDILTSKFFLKYMNDALNKYEKNENVMEISGYCVPTIHKGCKETAFLHFSDCWGWATWDRAWKYYTRDIDYLIRRFTLRDIYHFNFEGKANLWSQVIYNKTGLLNTWAIFWQASIYLNKGYMLYPTKPLVQNIGNDGTGEHKSETEIYDITLYEKEITFFPSVIEEDLAVRKIVGDYYKLATTTSFKNRVRMIIECLKYRLLAVLNGKGSK